MFEGFITVLKEKLTVFHKTSHNILPTLNPTRSSSEKPPTRNYCVTEHARAETTQQVRKCDSTALINYEYAN